MLLHDLMKKYSSFTLLKAEDFLLRQTNNFNNNIPLIIYDINNIEVINKKINKYFGNPEIQQQDNCIIVVPKDFMQREIYSFGDLVETIRRLRDEDGCQWDKAQTNMSIRGNAIEEAYELVEAIELNDAEKMAEESGDVMLQGLFNAVIAEEQERFSVVDIVNGLCKKLVTRHTHIFGNNKAKDCQEALNFWEKAKETEKNQQTTNEKILSVPKTFSALMRALKVQKIIKKTGFEFPSIREAEKKIPEELAEFKAADNPINREEEAGDLLFSVVNALRMHGINPELALNATTDKFIKRFTYIEKIATELGRDIEQCSLEEMERWYQQSKQFE